MRRNDQIVYVDPQDLSSSTSRLLIWQALKKYSTRSLIVMLNDPELIVRTAVARELQLRGGVTVWKLCNSLCQSKKIRDRINGLFILGQLGTPKLPYRKESLDLIYSVLKRERSPSVVEHALYAVGHLRKGEPLANVSLVQLIRSLKAGAGTELAKAKAFALGKR